MNELQALSEVGRAVNSTLDLNTVLRTIVEHAIALAEADAGAVFRFNEAEGTFEIAESSGLDSGFVAKLRTLRIASRETAMGEAALTRGPIQLADLALGPSYPLRDANLKAGFHSALVVPLIAPERARLRRTQTPDRLLLPLDLARAPASLCLGAARRPRILT